MRVAAFIRRGYEEHATIFLIARQQHRKELHARFQESDQSEIEATVMYINAMELLSDFMVDDQLDETGFIQGLRPILQHTALRGPIRIFGEMVAVLWNHGNTRAALRLEELWTELATTMAFPVLCAYPMSGFPDQHDASFRSVCEYYTHCMAQGRPPNRPLAPS